MSEERNNVARMPFGVANFEAPPSRFILEDFDSIQPPTSSARVKGLWPSVGVAFVGGPSMSGKSFWVLDALARVRRGEKVLGRKSVPSGVLYVASEDAAGVRGRIAGLRLDRGALGGGFDFIGQAPDLTSLEDVEDLKATIYQAKTKQAANGIALGVVAIDTLSASIPGADENSAADMSRVLRAVQELAIELEVLVLIVAHTGKDESRGLRGWSGLLANADGLIMLEAPEDGARGGTVVKVKNGASGDRFGFALRVVELGEDEDGDPVTTCVIDEADAPEKGAKAGRKPTKASASADKIMAAYGRVWDRHKVRVEAPGAPKDATGVLLEELRAEAYAVGLGPSEPNYDECETDTDRKRVKRKWQDQRKADFDRGLEHLTANKRLRVEAIPGGGGRLVWELNKRGPQ